MTRAIAMPAAIAAIVAMGHSARIARRRADPGIHIVNGTDALPCVWKWQVGLYTPGDDVVWCGGSLIAPNWVVTAKHCVDGESSVDVMAGNIKYGSGERRTSQRIIEKPDVDLALIELSEPFTMDGCTDVVSLPQREVPAGTQCWITGWGRTNSAGLRPPNTLQQAKTNIIAQDACKLEMEREGARINSSDVCVLGEYNGSPTSGCYGDSGGPLVCDVEGNGEFVLYGATAWGWYCHGMTVYAGIHSALDWIGTYVSLEPTPAPVPTPGPPPGSWEISGSGCAATGDCIHSLNYPEKYGNSEFCQVQLFGEVSLAVDGEFETESRYDKLIVDGVEFHGKPPANLAELNGVHSGSITWSSDSSVTSKGWKLCRTNA